MHIVTRKAIVEASKHPDLEQSNNTFIYALEVAKTFKEADLTPLFLYDPNNKRLIVTSKELMRNKFH